MPTFRRWAFSVALLYLGGCDTNSVPGQQNLCAAPDPTFGEAGVLEAGVSCFWGEQCISGVCLPTGGETSMCAGSGDCAAIAGWDSAHTVSCSASGEVTPVCVPADDPPSCSPTCAVGMSCNVDADCGPPGVDVAHACVIDVMGEGTCHAQAPLDPALLDCYAEPDSGESWCAPSAGVRNVALEGATCTPPGAAGPSSSLAINTVLRDVANAGGGAVYLPPCNYYVDRTLLIDDNTELFGHPSGSMIRRGSGTTGCVPTTLPAPDHEQYIGWIPYSVPDLQAQGIDVHPYDHESCMAAMDAFMPEPSPEDMPCSSPTTPFNSRATILNADHMCGNVGITVRDLDIAWLDVEPGVWGHPAVAMYSTANTTLRRLHVHDVPWDGIFINNYGENVVIEDNVVERYLLSHNNGGGIIVETYRRVPPSPLDSYLPGEHPSTSDAQLTVRRNRIIADSPNVHDNIQGIVFNRPNTPPGGIWPSAVVEENHVQIVGEHVGIRATAMREGDVRCNLVSLVGARDPNLLPALADGACTMPVDTPDCDGLVPGGAYSPVHPLLWSNLGGSWEPTNVVDNLFDMTCTPDAECEEAIFTANDPVMTGSELIGCVDSTLP